MKLVSTYGCRFGGWVSVRLCVLATALFVTRWKDLVRKF